MSVWAGATLYLRVMDGHRELYVPQGLSLDRNPQSCWKVKRDPQTNRTFFVNVAGLGKKWRLPDIYDPKNTLFLHRVDGQIATPIPNMSRRSSKPDGLSLVEATPAHFSGVNNSEPVGALTPAAAPPDHAPTPDVSRMVPAIEEPSLLKDLDAIDMPTDFEPVARDPAAEGDGYGGEGDWEQLSPLGRQRIREQQEAAERARQEEARAQDAFMSKVAAREYVFEFGDPEADARAAASPERIEAEHEAAVRLAEQHARTQARTEDVQRASSRVLEETRRREQSYDRERQAVDELERQQLEVIRAHTASLADPASDRSPSAASERVQRTIALSTGQQLENKQWQTVRSSSVASGGAPSAAHDGSGPSPWALLQEQLDFHRDRSEKLRVELEDRDRVILEHKLGDAERERREIALRVRMVEAMAAFREREQLLREEEMDAQDRAVEMRSANGRRAGSSSAPRHPLFEADLVTE